MGHGACSLPSAFAESQHLRVQVCASPADPRYIKTRSHGPAPIAPPIPGEALLPGNESSVVEPAHEPAREVVHSDIHLLRSKQREPQSHAGLERVGPGTEPTGDRASGGPAHASDCLGNPHDLGMWESEDVEEVSARVDRATARRDG